MAPYESKRRSYEVVPARKVTFPSHVQPTDLLNKTLVEINRPEPNTWRHHSDVTMLLKVTRRHLKVCRSTVDETLYRVPIGDIVCCGFAGEAFAFVTRLPADDAHELTCLAFKTAVYARVVNDLLLRYDSELQPELGGFTRREIYGECADCLRRVKVSGSLKSLCCHQKHP